MNYALRSTSLCALLICLLFVVSVSGVSSLNASTVCSQIATTLSSSSAVYLPGSVGYLSDNAHYSLSSSQPSACSIEPGTASDVSKMLTIIAAERVPFAVKSGGHATNSNFSSTSGILVSLTRFNETVYNSASGTVSIGTGLTWDEVYTSLEAYNVSVPGGRVPGVGVGGLALGGGYSWISQEVGLAIDNIVSLELVLPDGTILHVDQQSYPDLYFALRGSWNNFGIVTQIEMRAFQQGPGGLLTYGPDEVQAIANATFHFVQTNTDPKAQILASFGFSDGTAIVAVSLFYNGPIPPDGTFDLFLFIPALESDISTRSYVSLVVAAGGPNMAGLSRLTFNTVPLVSYSLSLINQFANQTMVVGEEAFVRGGEQGFTFYTIEPFLPSTADFIIPAAYPRLSSMVLQPSNLQVV